MGKHENGKPYYINEDGVTIQTWEGARDTTGDILLDDGRRILEGDWMDTGRVWASHPEENPNLWRVDGVWHWRGGSLREPTQRGGEE